MIDEISPKSKKPNCAPKWLLTFGDLMSLLFCMFVMLLSFADFNPDKFTNVAGPMRHAFHIVEPVAQTQVVKPLQEEDEIPVEIVEWKENVLYQTRTALAKEIQQGQIGVVERDREIIIRLPDATAFASGSADLTQLAAPILDRLSQVLLNVKGQVLVAGHTDDVPIATARFRSNWDLSAARAVSVVHHLIERNRVPGDRLTAQGFADSRPVAPNSSPENRALNRRVDIVIQVPENLGKPFKANIR
ncbi:MAG: OmpA family protein [Magnetospirillum sp. WYHS-4]